MIKSNSLGRLLILIIIAASALLLAIRQFSFTADRSFSSQALADFETPTPSPTPFSTKLDTKMDSPDGKLTLTMKQVKFENSIDYAFYVTGEGIDQPRLIFSKTLPDGVELTIPYNTWSPDNAYVFIKEKTLTGDNYLVFSTSEQPLPNNLSLINVSALFQEKIDQYILEEITGWAGPTLLIVNVNALTVSLAPSFWFEVPSQTFIPLSIRFN